MEKITSLDSDLISNLPRNVTETILTCLPLRDAVRTSILSRNWRYSWISIPKLVFDETICRVQSRDKVISIISRVLFLHQGPVSEFNLSHCVLERSTEIDNFIMFLSKNRVEDFTLNTLKWGVQEKYKLPSYFFSCREIKHLNLTSCIFTPPNAFEGFRWLVSLNFVNCNIAIDLFGNFVSSCPQLERLTLIYPSRFLCLNLKAPNLKYLHVKGSCAQIVFDKSDKDLNLSDGEEFRVVRFFQSLPVLSTLIADYVLLERLAKGGVPENVSTPFNIKFLKLTGISFDDLDEVTVLFTLISFSKMQSVDVESHRPRNVDETPILNFLEALDSNADILLDQLREVRLSDISGMKSELKFIKLLLARSPALVTMVIKPMSNDVASGFQLLKSLVCFERLAPMAKIIYEEDA